MKLIFVLIAVFSISAFADEGITAQVKYLVTNGEKAFGAQWFEGAPQLPALA